MGRVRVVLLVIAVTASVRGFAAVADATARTAAPIAITSVRAMPGYHSLVAGRLNVVVVRPNLAFRVTLRNSDSAQHRVRLRLAVTRGRTVDPLVSEVPLGTVLAHQSRTVTVRLHSNVAFAQKNWLRVQVASASSITTSARGYGVIFALG